MPDPQPLTLLPLLVALPATGAAALAATPSSMCRSVTMSFMLAATALGWCLVGIDTTAGARLWRADWIPSIGAEALLGLDGLNLPLVLLTVSLCPLALAASRSIRLRLRTFCVLMLLLETGVLAVFLAFDFVLFYVAWELLLVPMFLLIAWWGGEGRLAAAVRFFVYTLVGGLLMLAAGLLAYGFSDITQLSAMQLQQAGVFGNQAVDTANRAQEGFDTWTETDTAAARRFTAAEAAGQPARSFNLLALAACSQTTDALSAGGILSKPISWWVFVLLLISMAIKLPAVPLHTWLPQAHVEAPTGVSMLLAGLLLKLGGFALVRIAWPLCPQAACELAWLIAAAGSLSIVWGALAALAQDDLKRLVAYSSVSHMGYVLLGLAAGGAAGWDAETWRVGAAGAVFQMTAHGVTSAGLFYCVGVLYERFGHRDLRRLGGLINPMPLASGLAIVLFMANLGAPGLCGFVGELLVLLGAWEAHPLAVAVAAVGTILTTAYTLRALRLAYFGPAYRGERAEWISPLRPREIAILAPLALAAVVLGVRPQPVLNTIDRPLNATAAALAKSSEPPKFVTALVAAPPSEPVSTTDPGNAAAAD